MRIAVTGAGGAVGGQVVELLAAEPGHEGMGLARREKRSSLAPTVLADYADVAALRVALSGVDALVFVSSDGEAAKVLVHHENVVRAAAESGVEHVVALSGLDADVRSPFCYAFTYGRTEEALRASGCGFRSRVPRCSPNSSCAGCARRGRPGRSAFRRATAGFRWCRGPMGRAAWGRVTGADRPAAITP